MLIKSNGICGTCYIAEFDTFMIHSFAIVFHQNLVMEIRRVGTYADSALRTHDENN